MVPAPITHAVFIVHLSRGLRPRVPPAGPRMRRRPLASLAPLRRRPGRAHLSRGLRPRVPPAGPRMRRRPLASLAPLRRRPGRSLLAPLLEEVGHTLLLVLGLV